MDTKYYLIGPGVGTNLFKMVGDTPYVLNDENDWEVRHRMVRFLHGDPETHELTLDEAMDAYARITNGKEWTP